MSRHISMVFYTAIRDHDLIKADDVNVSHLVWAKSGQRKTGKTKSKPVTRVRKDEEEEESSDSNELLHLRSKETSKSLPIMVEVKVDDCLINMEVDTGASVSLMSYSTLMGCAQDEPRFYQIEASKYSKAPIPVLGSCSVKVEYNG